MTPEAKAEFDRWVAENKARLFAEDELEQRRRLMREDNAPTKRDSMWDDDPMDFWRGLVLALGVGALLWAIIGGIVWGLTR